MEKQGRRDSLVRGIESELEKDAQDIDADFIDRGIDELYALDGLSPPNPGDGALRAARTVRARAAWRRRNTLADRERKRRFARGVCAACCVFLFLFSANRAITLATGSCLPSRVGIKICCGTKYCLCDAAKEGENRPLPE
ncbi:MAG: hypothetical protein LBP27_05350 [Treponema sp.]|jgi:hypothetical protein|nr:hypothetical protein [Treponema sp.]